MAVGGYPVGAEIVGGNSIEILTVLKMKKGALKENWTEIFIKYAY